MNSKAVVSSAPLVVAATALVGLFLSGCTDSVPVMHPGRGMSSHMGWLELRHGPQRVSVSPARGLADRQMVRVRGTNFVPGRMYQVIECAAAPRRQMTAGECNLSAMVSAGADSAGTVTVRIVVKRGPFGRHGVICTVQRSCLVAVTGPSLTPRASAVARIRFAGT